jgi:hypothetical protein
MMWMRWAILGLLLASCEPSEPGVFIALQRDFAPFREWTRFYFGEGAVLGHPVGKRYGFVKRALQPGESAYAVGDMIVKTVEVVPSPSPTPFPEVIPEQEWDLFAMVKRGGNFNAAGAKNWEYFTLRINPDGVPVIVSRGTDASDDPNASGHGYTGATGNIIRCNGCHGDPAIARFDYIIDPQLQPR